MADDPKIGALTAKDYFAEAGNGGLKVFGGYIVEEYDPNLRGMRGARMYREMQDTDATVGAILFVINQAIRNISWKVTPADNSVPALLAAEFIEGCKDDMRRPWGDFMSEVCTMFTYGYAPFEIVLKERNGPNPDRNLTSKFNDKMYGVAKLGLRGQDTILRWIMDADSNEPIAMVQMPWNGGIRTIPIEKIINFRTVSHKNSPEGRSILRNAYRSYYFRKRMEEIEAVGIERDLAGLPIMSVPAELIAAGASGADPQAAQTLAMYQNIVKNVRRNTQEGVVLPSDTDDKGKALFELHLLSSGGKRNFDTTAIITRYTQSIASTVMADFLIAGSGTRSGGGQSLGTSKIEMFYAAIQGMVDGIADTLNTQLVPMLCELNGIPANMMPCFEPDKAEQVDLGRLGAYINALAASGMPLFPDPDLESYLRETAGLPAPSDETLALHEHTQQIQQAEQDLQFQQTKAATAQALAQPLGPQPQPQGFPPKGAPPADGGGGGGGGGGGPKADPNAQVVAHAPPGGLD